MVDGLSARLPALLRVLAQPQSLYLTLGLIAVASVGKFAGALLGGLGLA